MRLGDELKSASLKNRELISDLEIANQKIQGLENRVRAMKRLENEINGLRETLLEKDKQISSLLSEKEAQLFLLKQLQEKEKTGSKLNEKLANLEAQARNFMQRSSELQNQLFEKD